MLSANSSTRRRTRGHPTSGRRDRPTDRSPWTRAAREGARANGAHGTRDAFVSRARVERARVERAFVFFLFLYAFVRASARVEASARVDAGWTASGIAHRIGRRAGRSFRGIEGHRERAFEGDGGRGEGGKSSPRGARAREVARETSTGESAFGRADRRWGDCPSGCALDESRLKGRDYETAPSARTQRDAKERERRGMCA